MIKVSVIIPFYNAKKYISVAIESVIRQTYNNWELLLIDDGSNDDTALIIQKYLNSPRIKLYRKDNGGQGSARNIGIRHSSGELVAFLDADDFWKPEKLEEQIPLFNQGFDLVFSNASVVNEQGLLIGENLNPGSGYYIGKSAFFDLMDGVFFIPTLTVICKKLILENAQGFNESRAIQLAEDFDLWGRMFLMGAKAYGMNKNTAYYRKHHGQSSGTDYSNTLQVVESLLSTRKNSPKFHWKITRGIIAHIRNFYYSNHQADKKEKTIGYLMVTFDHYKFFHLVLIDFLGFRIYFSLTRRFLKLIEKGTFSI